MIRFIKFLILKIKLHTKVKFDFSNRIAFDSGFEGANKLCKNVSFSGKMGYGSYIAENSVIQGEVGRFTSIAPNVVCDPGTHPYTYPYVSTCPLFFSNRRQNGIAWVDEVKFPELRYVNHTSNAVKIGNDCWLGQNVFIVGGVTIGDGAVVLAGAVVTKDVPPYAVVGCVPAKIIRYRYSDADIAFLLNVRWWDKDIEWLKKNKEAFLDFSKLKSLFLDQ